MSKKKGVSADEKRDRMLAIFHESSDVFVLKDIEKLSVKRGIIAQAVKDVLQSLVDDDLVHQEKIGASNYFWSFPSEASVKLECEHKRLKTEVASLEARQADVSEALAKERAAKTESAERVAALEHLAELKAQVEAASAELAQYKDSDPRALEAMREGAAAARDAANRWLDNSYSLVSYCRKKFAGHTDSLAKVFEENGLTDDLEYVE